MFSRYLVQWRVVKMATGCQARIRNHYFISSQFQHRYCCWIVRRSLSIFSWRSLAFIRSPPGTMLAFITMNARFNLCDLFYCIIQPLASFHQITYNRSNVSWGYNWLHGRTAFSLFGKVYHIQRRHQYLWETVALLQCNVQKRAIRPQTSYLLSWCIRFVQKRVQCMEETNQQ